MDLNGVILLDKKPGITSFEAVNKVKKLLGVKKVGHAGTLDKFASGLLIICINKATSFQNIFMLGDKRYRALVKFGKQTDTLDPYGRVIKKAPVGKLTEIEIRKILDSFVGEVEQYPPLFSAIRVDGKRLYRRTLDGENVDVSPRRVHIHWINLIDILKEGIIIETEVSKGTYIRSLARDIAKKLNTVGYCEALRRLSIGSFKVERAIGIEKLSKANIISLSEALSFLISIDVDGNMAKKIKTGFPANKLFSDELLVLEERFIRVLYNGKLIALLENNDKIKYFKVLGPD